MTPVPSVIAVCGAGTMGAGIAQLAAAAGARVLVQDPQPVSYTHLTLPTICSV